MINDINTQINNIKRKVAEKEVLNNKLKDLYEQKYMNEAKLKELEIEFKKELDDVNKLNKLSLSNLVSVLRRNKEAKKAKAEKEYVMSKIEYDQCRSKLDLLKDDICKTETRLNSIANCEKEYSKLLERKIDLINIYGDEECKEKIFEMEKEIDFLFKEMKELEESLDAGNDLINEIRACKKILDSAKSWGTIDLLGGDLISSMAKHKKVDEAQKHFVQISTLLSTFNNELKDINMEKLNFSSTIMTFDIFFDNIFTDISVNSKISQSYQDVCNLERKVVKILNNLKEEKDKINVKINRKRREYDEFVDKI